MARCEAADGAGSLVFVRGAIIARAIVILTMDC